MRCEFTTSETGTTHRIVVCIRCGKVRRVPLSSENRLIFNCKAQPFWYEFGHWLSLFLQAVGITQVRYLWLKGKLGLTKQCGCAGRTESLNTWGDRLVRWLGRFRTPQK